MLQENYESSTQMSMIAREDECVCGRFYNSANMITGLCQRLSQRKYWNEIASKAWQANE